MGRKVLDIFKQLYFALNTRFWVTRYAISIFAAVAFIYLGKQTFVGGQIPFYWYLIVIQAAIFYPVANGFLVLHEWEHGRQAKGIFDNFSEMQAADFRKAQFRAVRLVNSNMHSREQSFGETKNTIKSDAAGMKMMFKFFGHVILWIFAIWFVILGVGRYLMILGPKDYTFNYRKDGTFIVNPNSQDQSL